jgi:hypothetical protein
MMCMLKILAITCWIRIDLENIQKIDLGNICYFLNQLIIQLIFVNELFGIKSILFNE